MGRPYYRERRHAPNAMITKMGRALRTEAVQTKGALHVKVIADDPDDDKFLACATEGGLITSSAATTIYST